MKLTKSKLKQIIKEELLNEFGEENEYPKTLVSTVVEAIDGDEGMAFAFVVDLLDAVGAEMEAKAVERVLLQAYSYDRFEGGPK